MRKCVSIFLVFLGFATSVYSQIPDHLISSRLLSSKGKKMVSGYQPIGFDVLSSFTYHLPPPSVTKHLKDGSYADASTRVPPYVYRYHQQKVYITGFLIPLDVQNGVLKNFLLAKGQVGCCFGVSPSINEWVLVECNLSPADQYIGNDLITVYGKLIIGEYIQHGEIISLYRIRADSAPSLPK